MLCLFYMQEAIITDIELLQAELRFKEAELSLKDAQLNAIIEALRDAGVFSQEKAQKILTMKW